MLHRIGVKNVDELFSPVPGELRLNRPLNIPAPLTELELVRHGAELASRNQAAGDEICFLGGGAYDHFIPTVVDTVASRSEFYTAYTPYQAEASQGSLQAFYEYQTLICQLTGMDIANASLYEGGSAVAEAVIMALNVTEGRTEVLVAESVHPEYRQTLATYLANLNAQLIVIPTPEGYLEPDRLKKYLSPRCVAVVMQHPNFFGCLEEAQVIVDLTHSVGALAIASFDPISLGILKRPGDYGVDIAIAEGQCLGTPLSYGGPYLGILACRAEFVRKIPGRLVGQTIDRNGKRCWVLTLQTREQHIRREKATSNICTNQGLFALRAAVYLTALGPTGLQETARLCLDKAHYAAEQLCLIPGVAPAYSRPFFKEFTVRVSGSIPAILRDLRKSKLHAGLHLGRWYPDRDSLMTLAVTEKRTKADIDLLTQTLRTLLQ